MTWDGTVEGMKKVKKEFGMKFERGQLLTSDYYAQPFFVYIGEKEMGRTSRVLFPNGSEAPVLTKELVPYDQDYVYEKNGLKLVPSGEGRRPEIGEWYLSSNNNVCQRKGTLHEGIGLHHPRVILLPIPELEPESEIKEGDTFELEGEQYIWRGEYRPVKPGDVYVVFSSRRDWNALYKDQAKGESFFVRKAVGRNATIKDYILEPKHEFEVGDWIYINGIGPYKVLEITPDGYKWEHWKGTTKGSSQIKHEGWPEKSQPKFTKAPGRPLNNDDLMRRLGGVPLDIECHACNCGKAGGVKEQLTFKIVDNGITFYHTNHGDMLAIFDKQGSIIWVRNIKNNIFVIEKE